MKKTFEYLKYSTVNRTPWRTMFKWKSLLFDYKKIYFIISLFLIISNPGKKKIYILFYPSRLFLYDIVIFGLHISAGIYLCLAGVPGGKNQSAYGQDDFLP